MTSARAFLARHPVATYVALTYAISWGAALVAIGGSGGMRGTSPGSDPRFAYAVMAMLAGPSVAGIALTVLVYGRAGLRDLLSRLLAWRVGPVWYAVGLLTAPVLMIATLVVLSSASSTFLPGIFTTEDMGSLLRAGLAVGVAAGVLEELGWTGFATPALRKHHGVTSTGVLVGVWWSAWHLLPNVWSAAAAAGDLAIPVYLTGIGAGVFVGYLTAFRVLMVWVYDRTQSVMLAMLMHVSLTTSLLILNPTGLSGSPLQCFAFAYAAAVWGVVAIIGAVRRGWFVGRERSLIPGVALPPHTTRR